MSEDKERKLTPQEIRYYEMQRALSPKELVEHGLRMLRLDSYSVRSRIFREEFIESEAYKGLSNIVDDGEVYDSKRN